MFEYLFALRAGDCLFPLHLNWFPAFIFFCALWACVGWMFFRFLEFFLREAQTFGMVPLPIVVTEDVVFVVGDMADGAIVIEGRHLVADCFWLVKMAARGRLVGAVARFRLCVLRELVEMRGVLWSVGVHSVRAHSILCAQRGMHFVCLLSDALVVAALSFFFPFKYFAI